MFSFEPCQIPATKPDRTDDFKYEGRTIKVSSWHKLVTSNTKVADATYSFSLYIFYDPHYINPLVLATDLDLMPKTVFLIYRDRWSREVVIGWWPPVRVIMTGI